MRHILESWKEAHVLGSRLSVRLDYCLVRWFQVLVLIRLGSSRAKGSRKPLVRESWGYLARIKEQGLIIYNNHMDIKQKSARYFSSKNGFIWEQQGIAFCYMQPW